jgi:hypothetical protein
MIASKTKRPPIAARPHPSSYPRKKMQVVTWRAVP